MWTDPWIVSKLLNETMQQKRNTYIFTVKQTANLTPPCIRDIIFPLRSPTLILTHTATHFVGINMYHLTQRN